MILILRVTEMFRRQREELPALPGAEEDLVRQKLKEVQMTSREQGLRLKEKETQLARLRELNRELRRGIKASGQGPARSEDIEEIRRTLADRENKLQVSLSPAVSPGISQFDHIQYKPQLTTIRIILSKHTNATAKNAT